jgi:hypothetical protein
MFLLAFIMFCDSNLAGIVSVIVRCSHHFSSEYDKLGTQLFSWTIPIAPLSTVLERSPSTGRFDQVNFLLLYQLDPILKREYWNSNMQISIAT